MFTKRAIDSIVASASLCLLSRRVRATERGTITGTVADSTGAVVPKVPKSDRHQPGHKTGIGIPE